MSVLAMRDDDGALLAELRRLQTAERRYRSLIQNMPDVMWSATRDGRFVFVSGNAEKVLGSSPAAVIEQENAGRERVHPDDRARVAAAYGELLAGRAGLDVEYRRRRDDGTWLWIQARTVGVHVEDGVEYIDGMFTDLTERRRLEEQIRQSQKLEAIGQLSGGVAHDFNNILSVILSCSQFLLDDLAENDPRRVDALDIKQAGERAVGLTRQLLAFSRRQVLEPTITNLDTLIAGLEKMLRRLIGEDIDLVVRRAHNLGAVKVDIGQLEQVIMNLVVNARDAMPTGGELSIETANLDLDELAASQVGCAPGSYVMFAIADTGCGMDAATRARIFEPFFTTKEKGHGTGLGLSTCYGIIQQSGGSIAVYSEPGQGAVFKVFLPRVSEEPQRHRGRSTNLNLGVGGNETILLVEDDEKVRGAVCRNLECRGYQVLTARDGASAVTLAASYAGRIHLVLSDVILPRASGPEVVAQIQAHSPGVRALYMSGYSDHAILRGGALQDGLHFIQKPFAREALAHKVREALDA